MTITTIENALTKEQCDYIISLGENNWVKGKVDNTGKNYQDDDTDKKRTIFARKCDIFWIHDKDIKDKLNSLYKIANKTAQWNFDINGMEELQLTRYHEGDYYNWHTDGNGVIPLLPTQPDIVRKVSVSVILNDDYTGGELDFMHTDTITSNKTGTVIMFPSYFMHKVKPVKTGTRYSLVAWITGPKFI